MRKLFSTLFSFISCFGLMFLVSCSDKDEDPAVEQKLGLYLPVSSTTRNVFSNEIIDSTLHFYNSNGKMERIFRTNGGYPVIPTNIVYDDQGRVFKIVNSQGRVIEEREYNAQGQFYKSYQFYDSDDPAHKTDENILEYDGQGNLIKINGSHSDAFNNSFQTINKFTYNAEGLIAIDSGFFFSPGTKPWFTRKIEYTYDDKKGINEYEIGEPRLERYSYFFAPLKHNITSLKRTEHNSNPVETTFQYLYNDQDLPVKINTFYGGSLGSITKITYKLF